MSSTVQNAIKTFKNLSGFPILNSGKLNQINNTNERISINTKWTLNDVVNNKTKTLTKNYILDTNSNNKFIIVDTPLSITDETIMYDVYSKFGCRRRAVLSKIKSTKINDKEEFVIHVYDENDYLTKSINLSALDEHDKILNHSYNVGKLEFSIDALCLYYIAVRKKDEKTVSYFETKSLKNQKDSVPKFSEKNLYKKEYGEQMDFVTDLVLCTLNIEHESLVCEKYVPSNYNLATFASCPTDSDKFALLAYKDTPYQLGLIYCVQRESQIFLLDMKSKTVKPIGVENVARSSPRFSNNGQWLVWLENKARGPHMQCQRLMRCNMDTLEVNVLVDVVYELSKGDEFTGIHSLGLIENCWSADDTHILLSSQTKCFEKLLAVDNKTGHVKVLDLSLSSHNFNGGSVSLLDVCGDYMLLKISSIDTLPFAAIAFIDKSIKANLIDWMPIGTIHKLPHINWKVTDHSPNFIDPKFGADSFQSIFVTGNPKQESTHNKRRLILCLHGGPHSAFPVAYIQFIAGAIDNGFCALLVNYRGSWGYGQKCIESLLGKIGEIDVQDCVKACEDVLEKHSDEIDVSHGVYLYGGSHGGYLTVQLAGRYSNPANQTMKSLYVRAGVCRNPVVNLLSHLSTTDIPDWCFIEANGDAESKDGDDQTDDKDDSSTWNYGFHVTNSKSGIKNVIKEMIDRSPLAAVGREIYCPILLQLGGKDKRVPPSQGIELYRVLKARGIKTEVFLYPDDCHPLSSVEANSDCFVRTMLWFEEN